MSNDSMNPTSPTTPLSDAHGAAERKRVAAIEALRNAAAMRWGAMHGDQYVEFAEGFEAGAEWASQRADALQARIERVEAVLREGDGVNARGRGYNNGIVRTRDVRTALTEKPISDSTTLKERG